MAGAGRSRESFWRTGTKPPTGNWAANSGRAGWSFAGRCARFGAMHSLYLKSKIGLGFLGLWAGGQLFAAEPTPLQLTEEAYQRNHRQYQMLCANCHGAEGKGGLGGSLVDGKWRRGGTPEEVLRSIKTGYPENGMPGYGEASSEADLRGLVAYLFETARRQNTEPVRKTAAAFNRELSAAGEKFVVEKVVTGLDRPWGLAWLPDGRMLVTERPGALRIVETGGRLSAPVAGVPAVFVKGQGGMLDVAVHPDYAQNGWIYLSFSQPSGVAGQEAGFTAVARGKIRGGRWVDQQMIFEVPAALHSGAGLHFGSRLVFDGKGHLFFGIGDRGRDTNAQNLAHPAGKIHRLHDDGRVPADNPFAGRADVWPSVWAYGVRNPQALVQDSVTRRLWETEHGPRGGDEFNLIEAGKNYGWSAVSRGKNYNYMPVKWAKSRPDVVEPLLDWTPSIGASGLAFYNAAAFPGWRGSFLAGGLVGQNVDRVVVASDGSARRETILKDQGRVRDVRVGPDGFVYIAFDAGGEDKAGRVVRLRPAGAGGAKAGK